MCPWKEHDLTEQVYQIKWRWRAFAIAWTAIAGLVWSGILSKEIFGDESPQWWHFVVAPLWIVGGLLWVFHMFRATVTLFPDAIETRGLQGRARLGFDEIRGRREYVVTDGESDGTRYFKVEPNDDRLPTLDFVAYYDFDYTFYEWFKKLPDLDAADTLKPKHPVSH